MEATQVSTLQKMSKPPTGEEAKGSSGIFSSGRFWALVLFPFLLPSCSVVADDAIGFWTEIVNATTKDERDKELLRAFSNSSVTASMRAFAVRYNTVQYPLLDILEAWIGSDLPTDTLKDHILHPDFTDDEAARFFARLSVGVQSTLLVEVYDIVGQEGPNGKNAGRALAFLGVHRSTLKGGEGSGKCSDFTSIHAPITCLVVQHCPSPKRRAWTHLTLMIIPPGCESLLHDAALLPVTKIRRTTKVSNKQRSATAAAPNVRTLPPRMSIPNQHLWSKTSRRVRTPKCTSPRAASGESGRTSKSTRMTLRSK